MGAHSLKHRGTSLAVVVLIVIAVLAAVGLAVSLLLPGKPSAASSDRVPPSITAGAEITARSPREPVVVDAEVDGAEHVMVNGRRAAVDALTGKLTARLDGVPDSVVIDAVDASGNRARKEIPVRSRHPGMRAVHLTAHAWSTPALREPALTLLRERKIDTIELDVKDESGTIGYASALPTAREAGAIAKNAYDARKAVEEVHALGGKVVGRLVVFRDPVLGAWAWQKGKKDLLVQRPNGQPWNSGYGQYSFTNLAHPEVRRYNIDLAVEAARLGFDDILYDYVRRPDGPLAQMRFPGLSGTAEDSVTSFVAESARAVREHGAFLGVSVFGIAVSSPTSVAQDIPALARHADYIAPMVYPSHWGKGEYGVSDPNAQPYEIVKRSLAAFADAVRGSRAVIIPWLQDFSLGRTYGPREVGAQIQAAHDAGTPSFLLWNAGSRYHSDALAPR